MIRVFIIDKSIKNRMIIRKLLAFEKDFKVIGEADDPIEAMKHFAIVGLPDVFLVSAHIERVPIFEFVRKVKERGIAVVVYITREDESLIKRLYAAGASKVIPAPREDPQYKEGLIRSIKEILRAKKVDYNKIIAIGSSTGGVQALEEIFKKLKKNHAPIVVTQHMPEGFTKSFAKRITNLYKNTFVKEAEDFDELERGKILLAPGNKHMEVARRGDGFIVVLRDYPKVNGHKPSIDVLFESVAREVGKRAVAFLLTGMGKDGAYGLKKIREAGGITYAQDEKSSVVYGMPKVAKEIGAAQYIVSLEDIPKIINAF